MPVSAAAVTRASSSKAATAPNASVPVVRLPPPYRAVLAGAVFPAHGVRPSTESTTSLRERTERRRTCADGGASLPDVPRFVVLLRGINVGTAKRVAMADLRALLADAGYTAISTYLNSGNVALTGDAATPDHLERAIAAHTGFEVRCVVLTDAQLRAIVDGHPFPELATNGSRMFAHVLGGQPTDAALAEAVALDPANTRAGPRVLYQWCPDGLLASPAVTAKLGVLVTARNWNTITKLNALPGEAPPPPAHGAPRRRGDRPG